MGEGENYGAGTSPAGALAHEPCCHTKGGSFRVGLKDGGRGRGKYAYIYIYIYFFFPKQFTVGVLNATLDLAALVLVGVVGFLGSEVVLSLVVSGCLPSCGRWVLVGVAAFLGSEVVLSPGVSGCLPSCGGWVLAGVAASRTKTFRNQNHRFQSKFAYCKVFGVYAGVIFLVFFLPLRLSRCPYMGKPLSGVGEQYCYTHWYVA